MVSANTLKFKPQAELRALEKKVELEYISLFASKITDLYYSFVGVERVILVINF